MAPPPRGRFYVEKFLGLKHHVGVACIGCVYLSIADETCAASFLAKTRDAIAFAASYGVLFLLLTSLVFLVYGIIALKAADGSIPAARRVYVFTTALAVLCVFGLFDETGFVALILTSYAAVVTRSHWIQLQEAATPALGYVVGEDSPAKPAADKV